MVSPGSKGSNNEVFGYRIVVMLCFSAQWTLGGGGQQVSE